METGIRFDRSTEATRAHFDRMAALYDLMQMFTKRTTVDSLRSQAWSRVAPGRILEAGVGAGRNIERYPAGSHVSGIDVSEEMLNERVGGRWPSGDTLTCARWMSSASTIPTTRSTPQ